MYNSHKVFAVILAAGKGTRMKTDKMLLEIEGKTVLEKSLAAFENNLHTDKIVVAAGDNFDRVKQLCQGFSKVCTVVKGGQTRAGSVKNALEVLPNEGIVAIHDGARPFVTDEIITNVIKAACRCKAALPCVPVKDTVKTAQGEFVESTPNRENLYIAQTPQAFDLSEYKRLLTLYETENLTDDCQLFEKGGHSVKIVKGEYSNCKITTPEDVKMEKKTRIGHGYDVHAFAPKRKLILGGVEIPHTKGLLGHSDADVLLHAVSDSLLGALALGDIGRHFPDSDPKYKGANSLDLLQNVYALLEAKGAEITNIDATLLCQKPKLAPHIFKMRENIAAALKTDIENISVKATTEEGLGFTGKEEGIAAHCICLVRI